MNSEDTRNLFLAIALSVLVMAGWQYFYAGPLYQRQHQAQVQAQSRGRRSSSARRLRGRRASRSRRRHARRRASRRARPRPRPCREALAASPRVAIDTPSVAGSINLKGGKLDDLVLKDYRETINKKSPLIRLLSPERRARTPTGRRPAMSASGGAKTPTLDTVWTADVARR